MKILFKTHKDDDQVLDRRFEDWTQNGNIWEHLDINWHFAKKLWFYSSNNRLGISGSFNLVDILFNRVSRKEFYINDRNRSS